jgi:hypothetical protein
MAGLCAEFGISRKTGDKIYTRYKGCGLEPHRSQSATVYDAKPNIIRGAASTCHVAEGLPIVEGTVESPSSLCARRFSSKARNAITSLSSSRLAKHWNLASCLDPSTLLCPSASLHRVALAMHRRYPYQANQFARTREEASCVVAYYQQSQLF